MEKYNSSIGLAHNSSKISNTKSLPKNDANDFNKATIYSYAGYKEHKMQERISEVKDYDFWLDGLKFNRSQWAPGNNKNKDGKESLDYRNKNDGFYIKEETAMRILEHKKINEEKELIISMSGSDDIIDFVQDARLIEAYKKYDGPNGFIKELKLVTSDIIKASILDIKKNPEIIQNIQEKRGNLALEEIGINLRAYDSKAYLTGVILTAKDIITMPIKIAGGAILAASIVSLDKAIDLIPNKLFPGIKSEIQYFESEKIKEIISDTLKIKKEKIVGENLNTIIKSTVEFLEDRAIKETPELHYKKMEEGRLVAISGIIKNHKEYKEIIISGHSLGGNLAGQFAKELIEKVISDAPEEDGKEILSKIKLLTYNSIGHDRETLKSLTDFLSKDQFKEFRDQNDFTESYVSKSNQYSFPSAPYRIDVAKNSVTDEDKFINKFSLFRTGITHSVKTGIDASHVALSKINSEPTGVLNQKNINDIALKDGDINKKLNFKKNQETNEIITNVLKNG